MQHNVKGQGTQLLFVAQRSTCNCLMAQPRSTLHSATARCFRWTGWLEPACKLHSLSNVKPGGIAAHSPYSTVQYSTELTKAARDISSI